MTGLLDDDGALEVLRTARIEPVGVLTEASNLTLLVDLHDADDRPTGHRAVYKPVRGERPLRDFPPGTLAAREVAAYLVSRAGGWDLVPPTVLREDAPLGRGSLQWWVTQPEERLADPSADLVEVLAPETVTDRWLAVVSGTGPEGEDVVVAHADDPQLRSLAVLDAVLNNADRKAAHLALDVAGRLRGFDHGLCLHVEDKLRTVLWGWAGAPLRPEDARALEALLTALEDGGGAEAGGGLLAGLVEPGELEALRARAHGLLAAGAMPLPPVDRYPLPWPLW
ncbi:SCO1664 family protein [Ornithinimicrobium humiphilum]|uniref:Putative repeat protein (TIGR03843 family) n=1 Tax=Ornithinimicrobium humiphilum TaxID=125288 RepID=A0A543KP94_9MICO|nr:SCO1664 family protein [Ornithinimicrobium humiphilum]TQM96891.1 putative repeat protein (TIGR03843 family) [Ornithinimicrobium humiphilum]